MAVQRLRSRNSAINAIPEGLTETSYRRVRHFEGSLRQLSHTEALREFTYTASRRGFGSIRQLLFRKNIPIRKAKDVHNGRWKR